MLQSKGWFNLLFPELYTLNKMVLKLLAVVKYNIKHQDSWAFERLKRCFDLFISSFLPL